jgi:endonuclease/exonuclease/phosphatase family metal-dependent hydrolase
MSFDIKVMTRNLYVGADFQPVIRAALSDLNAVPKAAAALVAEIRASDFPARAECLATEIAAHRPHVVGLQEAFVLRHRKPSSLVVPPFKEERAEAVLLDFAQVLLDCLSRRGLPYSRVVVIAGNDNQAPAGSPPALEDVRLTDGEAILVRSDLIESGIEITESAGHVFSAHGSYGPFQDIRAWAHVDLVASGRKLRIVTTHLQPLVTDASAALQLAQAEALIALHSARRDPLIVMGDFNSRADGSTTSTSRRFTEAGYVDVWAEAGEGLGLTCKAEELRDPARCFDERIDYVFCRNVSKVVDAVVTGGDPMNRTASGLWPSDHGGVVATIRLAD